MEFQINSHIKKNGIYYTPSALADYLVKPLICRPNVSIFDPACGEGALLFAAQKRYKELFTKKSNSPVLFGCDKISSSIHTSYLQNFQFYNCNFFKLSQFKKKVDIILMNPPFVRHHLMDDEEQIKYRLKTSEICNVSQRADLWVYFLLSSAIFLKEGGSIGAILPWSFLQSDYAISIRNWLLNKYNKIKILALSEEFFEKAGERIVLLWLEGYNKKTKSIKIAFSKNIKNKIKYHELDQNKWLAQKVVFSKENNVEEILNQFISKYKFIRFKEVALVRIGIVTGADEFFIMDCETAVANGFRRNDLMPILRTSKELSSLYLNGYKPKERLLRYSGSLYDKFKKYIQEGEKKGVHLRAHSLRRNPWFAVNTGKIPDAFFQYRVSHTPFLVLNNGYVQCTNSIHRIYFKELSENEKQWIQVSLLSSIGQLCLEVNSKTYGGGVLKIEPKSLGNVLVQKQNKKIPNKIYDKINYTLSKGLKKEAIKLASEFIYDNLGISRALSKKIESILLELQNRRFNINKN